MSDEVKDVLFVKELRTEKLGVAIAAVTTQSKINDPSGGATVDTEARTAINAIIDALEAFGLTAL